jgi:hypothetical protein
MKRLVRLLPVLCLFAASPLFAQNTSYTAPADFVGVSAGLWNFGDAVVNIKDTNTSTANGLYVEAPGSNTNLSFGITGLGHLGVVGMTPVDDYYATIGVLGFSQGSGDENVGVQGDVYGDSLNSIAGMFNNWSTYANSRGVWSRALNGASGWFSAINNTNTQPTLVVQDQGQTTGTRLLQGVTSTGTELFYVDNAGNAQFKSVSLTGWTGRSQSVRTTSCTTAATVNATCDTAVSFPVAFPDTNYTVVATGDAPTSGVLMVASTKSKTTSSVTVTIVTLTGNAASMELNVIARHD